MGRADDAGAAAATFTAAAGVIEGVGVSVSCAGAGRDERVGEAVAGESTGAEVTVTGADAMACKGCANAGNG